MKDFTTCPHAPDSQSTLRALMRGLVAAGAQAARPSPNSASAGMSGGKSPGSPHRVRRLTTAHLRILACPEREAPEDRAARFAWLAAIRSWVHVAVGGRADAGDQLLDLLGGRLTETEVAEADGCSASTVSRELHASLARIRWASRLATTADRSFDEKTDFTLDPVTATPVGPVPMWAVSLDHLGLRLPRRPLPEELLLFVSQRADVLRLGRGRRRYFRGWTEAPDSFWLEVTVLIPDREAAVASARKHHQRAISYLATGETYRTPYRERRRAA
jgi:hypothetical protein